MSSEIAFGAFYGGQTGHIETGLGDQLPSGEYIVTIELRDPATGASANVSNKQISTSTSEEQEAATAPPVSFTAVSGSAKPSVDDLQFLALDVTISNTGELIADAQLSLQVTHNGVLVENYVIVSPLSLPTGDTPVSSRYIPVDGWSSGEWSFTLSVQVLDRSTGVATVLATSALGEPVVVP
jgi:hypothetical protein